MVNKETKQKVVAEAPEKRGAVIPDMQPLPQQQTSQDNNQSNDSKTSKDGSE